MDAPLAGYIALTAVFVATPGAATAIVVRNAVDGGPVAGMTAGGGVMIANITYAVATALGLIAIVTRVPLAYVALQMGGAAYLAWLGMRSLSRAWSAAASQVKADLGRGAHGRSRLHTAFSQGFIGNLLNPSILAFYALVVPTFLRDPVAAGPRFSTLAGIHVSMAFACHTAWSWGFHALRQWWARPGPRRAVEALTGIALLGLAARILMP